MKNIIVLVLLISILLVIGILYYDSYTCSSSMDTSSEYATIEEMQTSDITNDQIRQINVKYNFTVSEGQLPQFIEALKKNDFVEMITVYKNLGYVYQGSFRDQGWTNRIITRRKVNERRVISNPFNRRKPIIINIPRWITETRFEKTDRAVPEQRRNTLDPNGCTNQAIQRGHDIAGLQYYGQCWTGNDMARATKYGRHFPRDRNRFGTAWSNEIYHKTTLKQTEVAEKELSSYEESIKWLTSDGINIHTYDEFIEFMKMVNSPNVATMAGYTDKDMIRDVYEDDNERFTNMNDEEEYVMNPYNRTDTSGVNEQATSEPDETATTTTYSGYFTKLFNIFGRDEASSAPQLFANSGPQAGRGKFEGLATNMPSIEESSLATSAQLSGDMYQDIKSNWDNKLSDSSPQKPNSFVFEFSKNTPEFPNLVNESIRDFNKIPPDSYVSFRNALRKNEIRNTYELEIFSRNLAEIGYKKNSHTNLLEILTALNKYGRKGFNVDEVFINRYKRFGLNSDSNLHEFLTKLNDLNVRDPPVINMERTPLPFPRFAELLGTIGVNYASFNRYCSVMDGLYVKPTADQMETLLKNIRRYFLKETINLDDVDAFKKELIKYRITYSEYTILEKDILTKVSIPITYKEFFRLFVEYYNTDYIRNQSLMPISTEAGSSQSSTVSLHTGLVGFFTNIQSKGFRPNLTVDFLKMIRNYTEHNVSGNTLKSANRVIEPKQLGFTTYTEQMTTIPEEIKPKYRFEGYYDALKKLGISDHENIMITLPESGDATPQRQTIQQFDGRLSGYLGAKNNFERMQILSYMVSINAPGALMYSCLSSLQKINVNMGNFVVITNSFSELGLNTFSIILDFVKLLGALNVNTETLEKFSLTLTGFGCTYKQSPVGFFAFLNVLTFYDITLTNSIYDSEYTKFDNFIYNMLLDDIDFKRFGQIQREMFTKLTNTGTMRTTIPTVMEKPELTVLLKDILVRKDALLFGTDNTVNGMNSMENFNANFQIDTSINVKQLYKNLTQTSAQSQTIFPLQQVIVENSVKTVEEVYLLMLDGGGYINTKTLRIVSQMLNNHEYNMMKLSPQKLHIRSVMSRLCSVMKTYIETSETTDVFLVLLLNSIRTFPYKTFDYLQTEFKNSGNKFDVDNLTINEGNVYTLLPPVKEPEKMPFTTIHGMNNSYANSNKQGFSDFGNYQTAYAGNPSFPFAKISDTKLYESYDLSKTSFMRHSNV